jgi:hypothetical protein
VDLAHGDGRTAGADRGAEEDLGVVAAGRRALLLEAMAGAEDPLRRDEAARAELLAHVHERDDGGVGGVDRAADDRLLAHREGSRAAIAGAAEASADEQRETEDCHRAITETRHATYRSFFAYLRKSKVWATRSGSRLHGCREWI